VAVLRRLAITDGETYAGEIAAQLDLHSTAVGRVIRAAAAQGWVTTRWELPPEDGSSLGHPPRRLVRPTPQGRQAMAAIVASAEAAEAEAS
jgi:DNA-binding MarR family transcriptional regulator